MDTPKIKLTKEQKRERCVAKAARRAREAADRERGQLERAKVRANADTSGAYRAKNERIAKAENRRQRSKEPDAW